jgi:starvation-inducible DNA-binding protein
MESERHPKAEAPTTTASEESTSLTGPTSLERSPAETDRVSREAACVDALRQVLSDTWICYLRAHGGHWNVTGPGFPSLHALFMAQYTELWSALDEIAERIRTLGAVAPSSARALATYATLEDRDVPARAPEMIRNLLEGHAGVIATLRTALRAAEASGDPGTQDLLTQRLRAHEKSSWILRSTLAPG